MARNKNVKTVKVGPHTSEHDWSHKLKKIDRWLDKGLQVKIQLVIKGRSKYILNYPEQEEMLGNILKDKGYKVINLWTKYPNIYAFINK